MLLGMHGDKRMRSQNLQNDTQVILSLNETIVLNAKEAKCVAPSQLNYISCTKFAETVTHHKVDKTN